MKCHRGKEWRGDMILYSKYETWSNKETVCWSWQCCLLLSVVTLVTWPLRMGFSSEKNNNNDSIIGRLVNIDSTLPVLSLEPSLPTSTVSPPPHTAIIICTIKGVSWFIRYSLHLPPPELHDANDVLLQAVLY